MPVVDIIALNISVDCQTINLELCFNTEQQTGWCNL